MKKNIILVAFLLTANFVNANTITPSSFRHFEDSVIAARADYDVTTTGDTIDFADPYGVLAGVDGDLTAPQLAKMGLRYTDHIRDGVDAPAPEGYIHDLDLEGQKGSSQFDILIGGPAYKQIKAFDARPDFDSKHNSCADYMRAEMWLYAHYDKSWNRIN